VLFFVKAPAKKPRAKPLRKSLPHAAGIRHKPDLRPLLDLVQRFPE
jgi:hypothetical protein